MARLLVCLFVCWGGFGCGAEHCHVRVADERPSSPATEAQEYSSGPLSPEQLAKLGRELGIRSSYVLPVPIQGVLPAGSGCGGETRDVCTQRALELERRGLLSDAAQVYGGACTLGSPLACGNLGGFYARGTGVSKSEQSAILLYRHACDSGQLTSCGKLALRRVAGCSEQPEHTLCTKAFIGPSEWLSLFERACADKHALACASLGAYRKSESKLGEAATLNEKACQLNEGYGCHNLADLLLAGKGERHPDVTRARSLHTGACKEGGFASSCIKAAMMMFSGVGGSRDERTGLRYLSRACTIGEPRACDILKSLSL